MKQRVTTAIIALIIFIPLLIIGGTPFNILVVAMGKNYLSFHQRHLLVTLQSPVYWFHGHG